MSHSIFFRVYIMLYEYIRGVVDLHLVTGIVANKRVESHDESSARAHPLWHHFDWAAVASNDLQADEEPNACAATSLQLVWVELAELAEHLAEVFFGDSNALVNHSDGDASGSLELTRQNMSRRIVLLICNLKSFKII